MHDNVRDCECVRGYICMHYFANLYVSKLSSNCTYYAGKYRHVGCVPTVDWRVAYVPYYLF